MPPETKWPKVSIVVINAKGIQHLDICLKSVLKTDYANYEVIVVDCLTSGIEKWIKTNYPQVKALHFDVDVGPSAEHNVGVEHADPNSRYVAFLDNDTEVDPNWLYESIKVMEFDPTIGAVQCKLLSMFNRNVIDDAGGLVDRLGYSYPRGRGDIDSGQYDHMDELLYASGAASIYRRRAINEVSVNGCLFDPSYFIFSDDIDVGWRTTLGGYRIVYVPTSKVFHKSGGTTPRSGGKFSSNVVFHVTKNKISMLIKNYNFWNMLKYLSFQLSFVLVRFVVTLRWRIDHSFSTLKAMMWSLKNFKTIWKSRLVIQNRIRKIPDSHVMKYLKKLDILSLYRLFRRYYD